MYMSVFLLLLKDPNSSRMLKMGNFDVWDVWENLGRFLIFLLFAYLFGILCQEDQAWY